MASPQAWRTPPPTPRSKVHDAGNRSPIRVSPHPYATQMAEKREAEEKLRPPRGETLLYLNGVNKAFDGFKAINDLSLVVARGEMRAIIGPNGAGKTTMMDIITGKTRPTRATSTSPATPTSPNTTRPRSPRSASGASSRSRPSSKATRWKATCACAFG